MKHLYLVDSISLPFTGLTPPPSFLYKDLNWSPIVGPAQQHQQQHQQQQYSNISSIPTLADRLETYRQMTNAGTGGAAAVTTVSTSGGTSLFRQISASNTIVSQSPLGNYTTSLVERTHDLRNWLKQAKAEHELLNGGQQTDL